MKIYCEQCHNDISKEVDFGFEKVVLGKIKCKKCGNKQKKFISEADLYLYIGICEVIYLGLSAIAVYVYDNMGTNLWMLVPTIIIFGLIVPVQKQISRFVYKKKTITLDLERQKDEEANQKMRKEINSTFMVFFALVFCTIILDQNRIYFMIGLIVVTAISFIRYKKALKQ